MTQSKIEKAFQKAQLGGRVRAQGRVSAFVPVATPSASGAQSQVDWRPSHVTEWPLLDDTTRASRRIIYPEMPNRRALNAFRDLKTKLLPEAQDGRLVVMTTSVVPGGGGSFVAVNLGVALSLDANARVLLVDCNLRTPELQDLAAAESPGLIDYLESSDLDPADIVYPSGVDRLWIVPSGGRRESPVEYFSSDRMRQLMSSLRRRQSGWHVILDAHPATESADTRVLSELCDHVLLVVPFGKVTQQQVAAAVEAVAPGRLLGTVLSGVP
jgi:protein-tyrosine kinase